MAILGGIKQVKSIDEAQQARFFEIPIGTFS